MRRWIAYLLVLGLMVAPVVSADALSKNAEGLYVDSNGNVIDESEDEWGAHLPGYYIGGGVAYPIENEDGSSSSGSSSSGGMTVPSSDGSSAALPEGAIINPDGSLTLESGSLQIEDGSSEGSGHLTQEEWAARLAKANARLGVTTGIAYVDENGIAQPATIEALGLGRSTITVNNERMIVPTAAMIWDTEAPEDQVLAVVSTTKQTYATMRAKKSQKAFVMGHADKCTVLLVISTGKTWTLVDDHGIRGYVLTNTLKFYDNKPKQYAAGIITVKGKTPSGNTVHVRSSMKNTARQIAEFPVGTPVTVFAQDEKWSEIDVEGLHCYILTKFVTLQEPLVTGQEATILSTEQEPNPAGEPEQEPELIPEEDPKLKPAGEPETETPADAEPEAAAEAESEMPAEPEVMAETEQETMAEPELVFVETP